MTSTFLCLCCCTSFRAKPRLTFSWSFRNRRLSLWMSARRSLSAGQEEEEEEEYNKPLIPLGNIEWDLKYCPMPAH